MSSFQTFREKSSRYLELPLGLRPRIFLLVSALLLVTVYLFPLWNLTMFAPQYPDGLRLDIYSYKLEGGNKDQDIREINILNHYIGMKELTPEDFTEFKWIPFVVGALALLILRTTVIGKNEHLVDMVVLFMYFGAFSLWSFAYKLYSYGHKLAPDAAVKVAPFTPPLIGHETIANFEIYSYPGMASYALGLAALVLFLSFAVSLREARQLSMGELKELT